MPLARPATRPRTRFAGGCALRLSYALALITGPEVATHLGDMAARVDVTCVADACGFLLSRCGSIRLRHARPLRPLLPLLYWRRTARGGRVCSDGLAQ